VNKGDVVPFNIFLIFQKVYW